MKKRIGFVVLGVSDVDRAVVFYRDMLGFTLVHANPAQSYAQLDAGGVGLKVVGGYAPNASQHATLEIVVDDFDAAYIELSAKGVEFPIPPARQPWGGRLAQLRDPDGNLFYLAPAA
jgi:catechol 2,3-dioxygenase-like lactoylglutathione lyase family enzyme